VVRHRDGGLHHLEVVDGGEHRRRRGHGADLPGQREFQIAVAAALAHPGALRIHGNAAHHDQVDAAELGRRHWHSQRRGALDGGGRGQPAFEPGRVQAQEAAGVAQAGHGHEDELAGLERAQAQRALRSVGIALDAPGRLPLRQGCRAVGSLFRALEVGDAIGEGRREPRHAPALQQSPDALTNGGLQALAAQS
jgi:hypothetical protein